MDGRRFPSPLALRGYLSPLVLSFISAILNIYLSPLHNAPFRCYYYAEMTTRVFVFIYFPLSNYPHV